MKKSIIYFLLMFNLCFLYADILGQYNYPIENIIPANLSVVSNNPNFFCSTFKNPKTIKNGIGTVQIENL